MPRKVSPFPPKTDFYSKTGADLIVEHLTAFWMTRGFHGISAQRYRLATHPGLYGIRSNIGATGFPPRRRRAV